MTTRIPPERARPNLARLRRQAQICTYIGAGLTLIVLLAEPNHGLLKAALGFVDVTLKAILN